MLSKFGAQCTRKAFTLSGSSSKDSYKRGLSSYFVYLWKTEKRADIQKRSFLFRKHPVRVRNISKCITIRRQTNMAPIMARSTTPWLSATSQYVQVNLFLAFWIRKKRNFNVIFLSTLLNCASFSSDRLHTKGKLALLKLNFETAVLEQLKTCRFAFNCPNTRVTCFMIESYGECTDVKCYFFR